MTVGGREGEPNITVIYHGEIIGGMTCGKENSQEIAAEPGTGTDRRRRTAGPEPGHGQESVTAASSDHPRTKGALVSCTPVTPRRAYDYGAKPCRGEHAKYANDPGR